MSQRFVNPLVDFLSSKPASTYCYFIEFKQFNELSFAFEQSRAECENLGLNDEKAVFPESGTRYPDPHMRQVNNKMHLEEVARW